MAGDPMTTRPPAAGETVHVTIREDEPPEVPVRVSVDGCIVSFNGVGTLWLNEPIPLADVLADPLTQQVAAAYRRGYVHHG